MKRNPGNAVFSLERRLSGYALAASAAGVGILASAAPAQAKIVYTPANVRIVWGTVPLDLNNDGITDFGITITGWSSTSAFSVRMVANPAVKKNQVAGKRVGNGSWKQSWVYALKAGARVGPTGPFINSSRTYPVMVFSDGNSKARTSGGYWANGGKGVKNRYLGLKFQIKGKTHYGWARLSIMVPDAHGTLTGYAYDTIPNKPIIAGKTKGPDVIPVAPATLGHLARGAAVMTDWRTKQ